MSEESIIINKVTAMSNWLYDGGMIFIDYMEQITSMLFLKMVSENAKSLSSKGLSLPEGCSWDDMKLLKGDELKEKYESILATLSKSGGLLGEIYYGTQNKINVPVTLRKLYDMIDSINWSTLSVDVKGTIYEGLLAKNSEDTKSGAGQYFTPRALIQAIVEVMRPRKTQTICDPACGSGGFLLAAQRYIFDHEGDELDRDDLKFLKTDAFRGYEYVPATYRLCLMNMFLHGIGDLNSSVPIKCEDSLLKLPSERFDIVLANPPFGTKSALKSITDEGKEIVEDGTYARQDFWVSTSNKQVNFVQHINSILKADGRAAIVVPDNVLFDGPAATVRRKLLETCNFHTILRLPTGIFYKQGVKANVIFFDKKPSGEDFKTKFVWVYDLRTNKHFTLKQNPMKYDDLSEFIECFHADNLDERVETYSESNPEGRFRRYGAKELYASPDCRLDLKWLKDDSAIDLDELGDPLELIEQYKQEVQEYSKKVLDILDEISKSLE